MSSFQRDEIATLRSENTRLRALLVKACVEISMQVDFPSDEWMLRYVKDKYGIRLRWNNANHIWEEDATK